MALIVLQPVSGLAKDADSQPFGKFADGFSFLNNSPNVTHWGLGAGVGVMPSPYKGDSTRYLPIPLVTFDNKWVHVAGTTMDMKIGAWSDVSVVLRGRAALFDGFKGSDAPVLNDMEKRSGAFWYGPSLEWRTSVGTLSGGFLLGGNKGTVGNVDFNRSFEVGRWSLEPYVGANWWSAKYVDYYYGVRPWEARAWRPAYTGESTWNVSVGTRASYRITRQQMVGIDVGATRLGNSVTESPIVGRRFIPQARLVYSYQFK
ncbi:MipA/OmpV family protein [Burkholderia sp. BCC1993]|uniref:MipA/OmpV family protein n=1 Tax=Burkholderia sp. BCC1993 TaxID=2817444 RepID=UPI002AAF9946|nr:MipA/OmpV family protein [Burkholderia sp. BCC1993]